MTIADAEKEIAPESLRTRRAREKLLKKWNEEKKQFTPKAIKKTIGKIHQWIADNTKYRIAIEGKSIQLFNQNQEAAAVSKKVKQFAEKLKVDMQQIFR